MADKKYKRIVRIFFNDNRMNDFYLELCEKYHEVRWGNVLFGETTTAEFFVR